MVWPKYASGEPSGRERLIEAFWSLLEEAPSAKIGVRPLCERARVNKNTFYYHWQSVEELAGDAVRSLLEPELFFSLISVIGHGGMPSEVAKDMDPERFRRVCLAAGGSSMGLDPALREALKSVWCAQSGAGNPSSLPSSARADLEFAVGGVMSVLAALGREGADLEQATDMVGKARYPALVSSMLEELRMYASSYEDLLDVRG